MKYLQMVIDGETKCPKRLILINLIPTRNFAIAWTSSTTHQKSRKGLQNSKLRPDNPKRNDNNYSILRHPHGPRDLSQSWDLRPWTILWREQTKPSPDGFPSIRRRTSQLHRLEIWIDADENRVGQAFDQLQVFPNVTHNNPDEVRHQVACLGTAQRHVVKGWKNISRWKRKFIHKPISILINWYDKRDWRLCKEEKRHALATSEKEGQVKFIFYSMLNVSNAK